MNVKENVGAKGHYKLIEADPSLAPAEYRAILDFLAQGCKCEEHRGNYARYRELMKAYHDKAKVAEYEFDNLIPTVGRSVIAQRLAGTTTYTGTINYIAVGTGNAAPANGDTTLDTETYRMAPSSQTYTNNIAYLSAFIPAGTATNTLYEGGMFIDGTGSADTGQLFSRVVFSPAIVKGALNSLSLDITITVT